MDVMDEVLRGLGNVEGKLDSLLRAHEEEKTERKSLGKRVSALERNQWKVTGGITVISVLIGFAAKLL